jgi:DNA-binding CsgD family transcriptional regulator
MLSNQELSKLLGPLYDAAADPTLWDPFLEQLARKTRSTSAALLIHDFEHSKYSLSSSWQMDPDSIQLYQKHYHKLDVWAQRGLVQTAGHVSNSQSLCPLSEMKTQEIYNDFMLQAGIEHGMFTMLENNKACLASVSLYRDRWHSEFTVSEMRTLKFLAPHLQRAFKLHMSLSRMKSHSDNLESALDLFPSGVLFLDHDGRISLMNRKATEVLAERDGLLANRAGLRANRPDESALLVKTVRDATALTGRASGGTVLISRRTRPQLQLLISPLSRSRRSSQAAVIFIHDPVQNQRPRQEVLRSLYGLTPAESRVALLLGDGHAPRKIAELIGVTDNTVRSQIKSVFSKTGIKRQVELVRLLLGFQQQSDSSRLPL